MRSATTVLLGAALALLLSAGAAMAAPAQDFTVTPDHVDIGTFYNGASLHVTGQAPAGADVVLAFRGQPVQLHMKRKGKVFGVLWMNTDPVEFDGVPAVELVAANRDPLEMGQAGQNLGLNSLRREIEVESGAKDQGDKDFLVAELVKLKRSEHLYRQDVNAVRVAADGSFECDVELPSRLTPGTYSLEVTAVKDGRIAAQSRRPVQAGLRGVPAFLAKLAFNHGVLYGILASVIAIVFGLIIGMVFKGGGGSH